MPESTFQIALGELVRLAFPAGSVLSASAGRDRIVRWVMIPAPGLNPQADDCVLCETLPSAKLLTTWTERGVAAIAAPVGATDPVPADVPLVTLPPKPALRDIQQSALQLIVNRQSYLAERGTRVYQTLAHHSLEDVGLEGLVRAIFDLTGKTAVVQDKRLRPLAVSVAPMMKQAWPSILEALSAWHQMPEGLRDRRQAAALARWRGQALPGGLARLVCPIVAKGMARGYLSIIGGADDLDALDQLVVEHGAAACALEMAKAKAVSDAEKRSRGDFVDAILTGTLALDEMVRWAGRMGYDVEPPHAALVWRWAEGPNAPSLRRLETIVNQSIAKQGVSALARPRDPEVVIFCAAREGDRPEAALALADTIRQAAADEYPSQNLWGGVGRAAAELGDWKDSYREATQSCSMAARLREKQPLYFGDLSVYRLLFQLEGNPELEAFCREALGPLLDYTGGGDLLETLEAFCERLGNLSQTAEKLFIHRNSLLYRLERVAHITGIDLDNPDTRLAVHLALKVRKMLMLGDGKRA